MLVLSLPSVLSLCCTNFCCSLTQLRTTHNNQGNYYLRISAAICKCYNSQHWVLSLERGAWHKVKLSDVGSHSSHPFWSRIVLTLSGTLWKRTCWVWFYVWRWVETRHYRLWARKGSDNDWVLGLHQNCYVFVLRLTHKHYEIFVVEFLAWMFSLPFPNYFALLSWAIE